MQVLLETIQIDFTDDLFSSFSGNVCISRMALQSGLKRRLVKSIRLKVRNRGVSDAKMLQSLIFCLSAKQGHLCNVDQLDADDARQQLLGLGFVCDSRRVSDYLVCFDVESVSALRTVAHEVADYARESFGYVPVFADGTVIEVTGSIFRACAKVTTKKINTGFTAFASTSSWRASGCTKAVWA